MPIPRLYPKGTCAPRGSLACVVVLLVAGLACGHTPAVTALHAPVTEYRGGRWFDGKAFVARTMWVIGPRFATAKPPYVDAVIDLHDGYVVPPFADGHNHWLEPALVDTYIAAHLWQGIFYVKDMSTPAAFHDVIRNKVNTPTSVDYIAAHQGFTGPGGHPIELIDILVKLGVLPAAWGPTHGEGDALFVVASEADLARAWPRLVATKPDFVKLFLSHSDEYATRRDDPNRSPKERALDPAVVPSIVTRAHAAGLRVTAHIENAADFHVAIAADVDDIAHMPFVDASDPESYRLAAADVLAAGARRVSVATTFEWLSDAKPDDVRLVITRDNLSRLRAAGAVITIGTDLFRLTARAEADRIAALHLMTNAELLVAWTMTTPRSIFPARSIGRFEDATEASFLVLAGDPLADFAQTHQITVWVKQGQALHPPHIEMPPQF